MALSGQDRLGSYRLLNIVRSGKNCQIWEAMHEAKNERCALKVVMPEYRNDKEQIALLKREYLVGNGFNHPRVIKIFDLVMDDYAFLAMEYFPAPNLKQWIHQGVDRMAHLVQKIIEQGAEGLDYVNRQGWVHRDIKPDNFLASKTGDTKLIDFAIAEKPKGGLAKLFGGKSKVQGTRSYMSPEQIRGQSVDERADIYSFGCTFFEVLAGKPPFTGQTSNDLLTKHLKSPPPPLEGSNNNVTPEFSGLMKRMLAKEPKARPQSMGDVLRELKRMRVFKVIPIAPPENQPEKSR